MTFFTLGIFRMEISHKKQTFFLFKNNIVYNFLIQTGCEGWLWVLLTHIEYCQCHLHHLRLHLTLSGHQMVYFVLKKWKTLHQYCDKCLFIHHHKASGFYKKMFIMIILFMRCLSFLMGNCKYKTNPKTVFHFPQNCHVLYYQLYNWQKKVQYFYSLPVPKKPLLGG